MIFGSKKATVTGIGGAVIAVLAALLPALGAPPEITEAAITIVGWLLATYNIGQGIADHGKEAAKIENE